MMSCGAMWSVATARSLASSKQRGTAPSERAWLSDAHPTTLAARVVGAPEPETMSQPCDAFGSHSAHRRGGVAHAHHQACSREPG